VPSINLDHFEVDPAIIKIIPAETSRKYQILPLSRSGATLTIAMADPTNVFAMDDIKFMTGYNVEPVVASETSLEEAIEKYYGSTRSLELHKGAGGGGGGFTGMLGGAGASLKEALDGPGLTVDDMASVGLSEVDLDSMAEAEADVETVKEEDEIDLGNLAKSSEAAPVIKLTNVLLVDSLKRGASDIHIEPYEKEFRVRFRIDGVLYNVMALPLKLKDPLTSRIKIMAKLDIAEKRLPQDGRIKIKMKVEDRSRDLDFRVSCLPTLWGEKIVLRLLDKTKLMLDMTKLGFEPHSLERFKNAIAKPYGIVLVTGPTGSGKTNTLYSAIASLNKPDTNIMTAEDPVEFNLPGINQVQIRDNIGLNFAAALRSFLRQDPNIILVGEIRDYETAEIAVKAALTGHLVLSTLHTNDAPSTVSRMVNMGIEPFLVGTAVNLIQAQRLVRRICAKCKVDISADVPSKTLIDIGFQPDQVGSFQVVKGRGCANCNGTGYKGRVGLYEVMEITEGIRDLIMVGATAVEIKRKALEEGMLTLRLSGLEKIRNGVTTVEEVLRETVL
jgi:type IV pilus assembly protein PilB